MLVAGTRVDEAEGARERSMSAALLPRVNAQTYANFQNRNLRAFGISVPGMPFPNVVGPFSNYDFRIYAQQNVIDLQSYRAFKASELAVDAGKMDEQDARDLIVRSIAALYLNAQSAAARVGCRSVARNGFNHAAQAGHRQARCRDGNRRGRAARPGATGQRQAGVAGRAERAASSRSSSLARNLGMSPGTPLELAEPLQLSGPWRSRNPTTLLPAALKSRADYLSLASQRQSLVEQQRANRARYYPKLSLNGNIGELGRSIGSVQTTGLIQGQIDFTVFDRDRSGEAAQLASRVKRIDDQIADLERGVDQDIRQALLNLDSAAEQVDVAQQGQELAQRELLLAQDRFQAGTANNVEVVTAQDELARAEENYIVAVSSHVDAKFALARAMGDTEKNILAVHGEP